jgi:hypothetical protein
VAVIHLGHFMKIITTLRHTLGLCLLLGVSSVFADMPLETDKQISGIWRLEFQKKNAESTKVIERTDTWLIEGGKLTVKGIVHDGNRPYDSIPASYLIEDNLLKVALGRHGKFDTYTLMERSGDIMVLKDRMGVFYHFKKK